MTETARPAPPRAVVVLVAWNSAAHLEAAVRSVPAGVPVIVVDNASSDASAALARAAGAFVVDAGENLGFGPACNRGVAECVPLFGARPDAILFLNPDAALVEGRAALDVLLAALDADARVAAAAPRLVGEGQERFQLRRLPTLRSLSREAFLVNRVWPRNRGLLHERYLDRPRDTSFDVEQPAGAALLVRRTDFEAVGGFDPAFAPAWFEDVDLCARLWKSGRRIRYVPGALATHVGGTAMNALPYRDYLPLYTRNLLLYLSRHWAAPARLLARGVLASGALLRLSLLPFVKGEHARGDAAAAYGRVLRGLCGPRMADDPAAPGTVMPRIVVSLVTRDESHDVERLLPSLFAQTFRDFAIVATDNASEDGTRATLAAFQKVAPIPMTIVASRQNLGYTGGHNGAIERAVAEGAAWVLVLNTDVVLEPDFLERLLAGAERPGRERTASFTGKVRRAEGAALSPTGLIDTVGIRMTRGGRHFDIGAGTEDDGRYDAPAEVFGVSGCAALHRVAALLDVKIPTGFFDDDFFLYREDVDLAWRLRGRGWNARCVPGAVAYHRRRNLPERRGQMTAIANLHSVKNRFLLRINNAGSRHILSTLPATLARDLVVVGGCLTIERTSLHGLRWLALNRERLLQKRAEIQGRRTVSDASLSRWFSSDPDGRRIPDPR